MQGTPGSMQVHPRTVGIDRRWFIRSAVPACLFPTALLPQETAEVSSCALQFNSPGTTIKDVVAMLDIEPIQFKNTFENNLILVLFDICESLQVNFAFGYFDDAGMPNACWHPHVFLDPLLPNEDASGTVLMGRALLQETLKLKNAGAAMTAFCAHEAGHALQSKHKVASRLSALRESEVRDELCADFICGYYAARRHAQDNRYPVAIQAVTEYRKGQEGPVPVTHGTPNLRALAISEGFKYWRQHPDDGLAAISAGTDFASSVKI